MISATKRRKKKSIFKWATDTDLKKIEQNLRKEIAKLNQRAILIADERKTRQMEKTQHERN
jgi:hypothetical protein